MFTVNNSKQLSLHYSIITIKCNSVFGSFAWKMQNAIKRFNIRMQMECKWANSTRYLCVQALTWSLEICIVAWKTLERRARRALIVRFKGHFRGKESIAEGGLPFNSCEFFFFSPPFEETLRRKHASSSFHFHLTTEL